MPEMRDYSGSISTVAADYQGVGVYVNVAADVDPKDTFEGWVGVQPEIAREGLAVAIAAVAGNLPISVRMVNADRRVANAVRARVQ